MIALRLFFALWALVAGHVAVHELPRPITFTDIAGAQREEPAAAGCPDGHAELWWQTGYADLATLDHELAHVADCIDDGVLNGSFGPAIGRLPRDPLTAAYCARPVETPACVAQFDPQAALVWLRAQE